MFARYQNYVARCRKLAEAVYRSDIDRREAIRALSQSFDRKGMHLGMATQLIRIVVTDVESVTAFLQTVEAPRDSRLLRNWLLQETKMDSAKIENVSALR